MHFLLSFGSETSEDGMNAYYMNPDKFYEVLDASTGESDAALSLEL